LRLRTCVLRLRSVALRKCVLRSLNFTYLRSTHAYAVKVGVAVKENIGEFYDKYR